MNNDGATIYNSDEKSDISYSYIWYSTGHITLRNHKETWKPLILPSKQRWYSWASSFNQNFRKFRSKRQLIGSVQPEKFRKNWSNFWGGPLFPVGPVGSLVEWIAPHVTLTICLFCTRRSKERQIKRKATSESLVWGSTQLCAAFRIFIMHSNTQFCTKNSLNLGLKRIDSWPWSLTCKGCRLTKPKVTK